MTNPSEREMKAARDLGETAGGLILVCFALFGCQAKPDDRPSAKWQVVQIIGANNDAQVMQDPDGCLWFATLKTITPLLTPDGKQRCVVTWTKPSDSGRNPSTQPLPAPGEG